MTPSAAMLKLAEDVEAVAEHLRALVAQGPPEHWTAAGAMLVMAGPVAALAECMWKAAVVSRVASEGVERGA